MAPWAEFGWDIRQPGEEKALPLRLAGPGHTKPWVSPVKSPLRRLRRSNFSDSVVGAPGITLHPPDVGSGSMPDVAKNQTILAVNRVAKKQPHQNNATPCQIRDLNRGLHYTHLDVLI